MVCSHVDLPVLFGVYLAGDANGNRARQAKALYLMAVCSSSLQHAMLRCAHRLQITPFSSSLTVFLGTAMAMLAPRAAILPAAGLVEVRSQPACLVDFLIHQNSVTSVFGLP